MVFVLRFYPGAEKASAHPSFVSGQWRKELGFFLAPYPVLLIHQDGDTQVTSNPHYKPFEMGVIILIFTDENVDAGELTCLSHIAITW